jgi:hypothetical protein
VASHSYLTADIVAKEALMLLENNLVMGNLVHRGYREEFGKDIRGAKPGTSVRIRIPNRFTVTKSRVRTTSGITESYITLTCATQAHVSFDVTSVDLTMKIGQFSERYLKPAIAKLANTVDADVLALYKDVANSVWESTGFVTPESFIVLGKAAQKLDEEATPNDQRHIVVNPAANWSLANALRTVYVDSVAAPAIKQGLAKSGPHRKGYFAPIAGFDVYMDQNVKTHTTGDFHSTGSTAAILAGTTGGGGSGDLGTDSKNYPMLDFKNVASKALRQGDVFTIADVIAVQPMSGESTGVLRQFVVTADASNHSSGTGDTTLSPVTVYFEPPMIDTGAYKNVDTLPAAGAAVSIVGTQGEPFPQNLAFHKNAFALVVVPLEIPDGASWGARATSRVSGMSVRVMKDYDIVNDEERIRLDILYGVKTLQPEMACRIWGAEG